MRFTTFTSMLAVALGSASCTTTGVQNAAGTPTTYQDVGTRGPVSSVGIESQDIVSMTDKMARDMLQVPALANASRPPRVIIDARYFKNESDQPLNKDLIVERLAVELQRAAHGRMAFVGRRYAAAVEHERALKRAGKVDVATTGLTRAAAGADYRLTGEITSLDAGVSNGMHSSYHEIFFHMIDLETGIVVWSGLYEFKKAGQEDVIYR